MTLSISMTTNTAVWRRNSYLGSEFSPSRPKTIRTLAKRFMAYRAAKAAAEDTPVDLFCRRGDSSPRFAYFD